MYDNLVVTLNLRWYNIVSNEIQSIGEHSFFKNLHLQESLISSRKLKLSYVSPRKVAKLKLNLPVGDCYDNNFNVQVACELYDLTNCTMCFRHGGVISS